MSCKIIVYAKGDSIDDSTDLMHLRVYMLALAGTCTSTVMKPPLLENTPAD